MVSFNKEAKDWVDFFGVTQDRIAALNSEFNALDSRLLDKYVSTLHEVLINGLFNEDGEFLEYTIHQNDFIYQYLLLAKNQNEQMFCLYVGIKNYNDFTSAIRKLIDSILEKSKMFSLNDD